MIVHWNDIIFPWSIWWKLASVTNTGHLQPNTDNLVGLYEDQEHSHNSLFHVQQWNQPHKLQHVLGQSCSENIGGLHIMGIYTRISNFLRILYSSTTSFCSDLCTFSFCSHHGRKGLSISHYGFFMHTDRNAASTLKSWIDSNNRCGALMMGKEWRGKDI